MTVSIIGSENKLINEIFSPSTIYNSNIQEPSLHKKINEAYFTFICIPTSTMNSGEIDVSIFEYILEWLKSEVIIISSTVPPKTTRYFAERYNKRIVFLSTYHVSLKETLYIIGGNSKDVREVANLLSQKLKPKINYLETSFEIAELCNYINNIWFAAQITLQNELSELTKIFIKNEGEFCHIPQITNYNKHFTKYQKNKNFSQDLRSIITLLEESNYTTFFFDGLSRTYNFNMRKNSYKNTLRENNIIKFYQIDEPYGYFSNFSQHPVYLKNKIWQTTEHYYQAQKYANTDYEEKIRLASSPVKASKMGRNKRFCCRSDWNSIKDNVMYEAIYAKFTQHPDLKSKLITTGKAKIVEHTRNDSYWGDGGDGSGKNMLGIILMKVRKQLLEENS